MGAKTAAFLALCVLVLTSCGQSSTDVVLVDASINGSAASDSSPGDPITITDGERTELILDLENTADTPTEVRYVRFEGRTLDMVFLTYDTEIAVELAGEQARQLPPIFFNFFDLGGQASGYLRGQLQLFDADRELIGSQPIYLDASGDGFSTLSWFNLLLLLAAVGGAGWNLVRLAQRRLPSNRFIRAIRFAAIGVVAGLAIAAACSTLRIWPLDTLAWVLIVVISGIIGYAVGFLLPGGDDVVDLEEDEDEELERLASKAEDKARKTVSLGDDRETVNLD
ncbi:MAG: hypothetical protein AAF567_11300 [Actinomycetota bacterium]